MSPGRQNKFIGLIGLILIILTLWVGWWFYSNKVETILSVDEVRCDWSLSPKGDKVIYSSNLMFLTQNYTILMFLATNQKYTIREGCSSYGWLDNTLLILSYDHVIIDTDDFIETPYRIIKAVDVNVEALLKEAGTIYVHKSEPGFIFVLAYDYRNNPDKNYLITGVKNIDEVLQGRTYVLVPNPGYSPPIGKVYSPNGAYYYQYESFKEGGAVIAIYDAANDQKLSQTPTNKVQGFKMGGWAADSSGVYYQLTPAGFWGTISPLYKLKVPQPFPFW